jgi:hypothetical protein
VTLLARETLPPISLSPALLKWSSTRTPFPLFAPLAPAPGETAESRVSSRPGPEMLYAPCQPQRSSRYGIQSADSCIPETCWDCLQATKHALRRTDKPTKVKKHAKCHHSVQPVPSISWGLGASQRYDVSKKQVTRLMSRIHGFIDGSTMSS